MNHLKRGLSNTCLTLLIVLPTAYAYLNAVLFSAYGDPLFPILLFLALARYLTYGNFRITRAFLVFLFIYLGITLICILFPLSEYTDFSWTRNISYRILCAFLIVLLFEIVPDEHRFLKYLLTSLTLFLTISTLLTKLDLLDKSSFAFLTPLPIAKNDPWNIKFFASWLLFLTWGTVCLHWRASLRGKCIALIILSLSAITILSLTSQGAKLALVLSILLFVVLQLVPLKKSYILYLFISLSFLVLPLICIAYFIKVPYDFDRYEKSYLKKVVINRIYQYHHAYSLFLDKPVLGYGFGSAAAIPFPDAKDLVEHWKEDTFPGRQPHNLTFLFLIEHGVIGIFFLIGATYYFFNHVYSLSATHQSVFFALPLLLSFHVIFSFSYAIWRADIVLIVLFFMMMMRIILSDAPETWD